MDREHHVDPGGQDSDLSPRGAAPTGANGARLPSLLPPLLQHHLGRYCASQEFRAKRELTPAPGEGVSLVRRLHEGRPSTASTALVPNRRSVAAALEYAAEAAKRPWVQFGPR